MLALGDRTLKPPIGLIRDIDFGHPQLRGCTHWWPMLEGAGTTAREMIAKNHGTLTNFTVGSEWGPGKDGPAPVFDGVNDRIHISSIAIMVTAATITFRAKRSSTTTGDAVLGNSLSSAVSHVRLSGTGTLIFESDTIDDEAIGTLLINDTAWHGYAVVLSGTSAQFYQDGRPLSMTDGTISGTTLTVDRIGIMLLTTNAFVGLIDDVRIYNRTLSQAEIVDIYLDPWAAFVGWSEEYFATFAGDGVDGGGDGGGGWMPSHAALTPWGWRAAA